MTDLGAIYRQALPGRIAALEMARGDTSSVADTESVRRIAHALRGSGGTYGFPQVSEAAAAAEDATDADMVGAVDRLLVVLKALVAEVEPAHILGIEDEPEHALLIRAILGGAGHMVTVVGTAAEAMDVVEQGGVSLIVLDLLLPDSDGRSLLLKLREHTATSNTPIIVLSARSDARAKAECFGLGASGFLEKPIEPELLSAVVSAQLRAQRVTPSVARLAGDPTSADQGRRKSVLVVEDDELVVTVLRHRLERDGFRIVHCADGVSALETLDRETFELVILDVKIPGLDGFNVLTRMRGLPHKRRTPVIMLTSMGGEKDVLRAFQLGADDYITKPFSPVEVLARVKRLLQP